MTSQAVLKQQRHSGSKIKDKNKSIIKSSDALAMVEHGGELTIGITTPVGTTFRCKTAFIGSHSDNYVLAELPKVSDDDLDYFFQEGFWATVRAISPRGEGALIHFRSQLVHVMVSPVPMVALSVPQTMEVTQLRKEPRYDVNLAVKVIAESHRLDGEIRDLSKGGCRFITAPLSRSFQVGEEVSLNVMVQSGKGVEFQPLFGKICNLQRSHHYSRYGVAFTDLGAENAKNLLGKLKFDGTKLTLR